MRIGLGLEMEGTIDEVVARAQALAATGVSSLWSSQIFGWDTLTALAVVGREVPAVTLGTAVIPVHPRHPTMLAAQALTVQAATGGRLVLGIGLSHKMVVEGMWGFSFDHPARYMEEYLSILMPMLAGEQVSFQGEVLRANTLGPPETTGATAPPVLVAALGPVMLGIAARQASGTITWMVGLKTLADHIVPTIPPPPLRPDGPAPRWSSPSPSASPPIPRRPGNVPVGSSPSTASSPPTGPCSTARGPPGRPTWPSSAPKKRWPPPSGRWLMPVPPSSRPPPTAPPTRSRPSPPRDPGPPRGISA